MTYPTRGATGPARCGVASGARRLPPLAVVLLAAAALLASMCAARQALGAQSSKADVPARYAQIAVVAPSKEQTIYDNLGSVEVRVALSPALQSGRGHRLQIFLDERLVATLDKGQSHVLKGVERGTHTVHAKVVDADARELIASEAVTFHMWQASVLFPQRRGGPLPR